jgi:ParB family chromosome partitioning protein
VACRRGKPRVWPAASSKQLMRPPGEAARPEYPVGLQDNLSERLGARVQVRHETSGKGRVVIHYNTLDELDGIISRVK